MNSHLRACPSCARHVRVSETACPFCRATLSSDFRASPAPRPPRARLSRAALRAFGTGALALTAACSSSSSGGGTGNGPPKDAGGDAVEVFDAAYGGPPVDASDDSMEGVDTGGVVAAYGAPALDSGTPPTDAGTD
jgi:hypothetical protein